MGDAIDRCAPPNGTPKGTVCLLRRGETPSGRLVKWTGRGWTDLPGGGPWTNEGARHVSAWGWRFVRVTESTDA